MVFKAYLYQCRNLVRVPNSHNGESIQLFLVEMPLKLDVKQCGIQAPVPEKLFNQYRVLCVMIQGSCFPVSERVKVDLQKPWVLKFTD